MDKVVYDPYGFIYITTNMINGKRYIGQKRFDVGGKWKSYLGSGKLLKRAISKYGSSNFKRDIVYIAYSQDDMDKKEVEFINNHNAVESDDYYNLTNQQMTFANIEERKKSYLCKKVICIDDHRVFDSMKAAYDFYKPYCDVSEYWIKKCITKRVKRFEGLYEYRPIFRKYKSGVSNGYKMCSNCGKLYNPKKQGYKTYCDKCADMCKKLEKDNVHIYNVSEDLEKAKDQQIINIYSLKESIEHVCQIINQDMDVGYDYICKVLVNNYHKLKKEEM